MMKIQGMETAPQLQGQRGAFGSPRFRLREACLRSGIGLGRVLFALFVVVGAGCGSDGSGPDEDTELDAALDAASDVLVDVDVDTEDVPDTTPDSDTATELDAELDVPPGCEPWWDEIAPHADGPGAGTDGADPAAVWNDGTTRAGRVRSGDGGFGGPRAACRTGDWVLENDHLRVCIADERSMSPMLFDGGNIVDIVRRDAPALDELYYMVTASKLLNQGADLVELVDDGSGGGPAVLRVTGPDVLTMFGAATVGPLLFPPIGLSFVTEYRLSPETQHLEIATWVSRPGAGKTSVIVGDLVGGGDTARTWFEDHGLRQPPLVESSPLYVSVGQRHSVGVWSESLRTSEVILPEVKVPFGNLIHATGPLCSGATAAYRRFVAVGDGDTLSVRAALADVMPARETTPVTFEPEDSAAAANHVEIRTADGYSVDIVRVDGETDAALPAGDYVAVPLEWPLGDAPEVAFSVPAASPVVIPAPELGAVEVALTRDDGDVILVPGDGMLLVRGPVTETFVIVDGEGTFTLPPGSYEAFVDNGPELSAWSGDLEIVAGETAELTVTLLRELDSTGWVAGDMHQHATPSPDSQTPLRDRVLANLGAGVDFIAPSDHDAVGDFPGAIAELGLTERLFLLSGEELSPGYGHINLFPRPYDRQAPYAGAIPLGTRTPGAGSFTIPTANEYITTARAAGVQLVQLNHPRGPLAYFDTLDYDPIAGPSAVDDERWTTDFDAIEVYNIRNQFCTGLRDWFSLLGRGLLVAGMGNSDTHDLRTRSGWPRNYIHLADDPMSESALLGAINELRVSVSGGILLTFGGGLLPGDTLAADSGTPLSFPVRVQAPSWLDAKELVVFVDGVEVDRITLPDVGEGVFRNTLEDVELSFDADSYVVFVAYGDMSTPWPSGLRSFAFTNPVFVDVGDNGWVAPGVASAEDLPLPTGLPNCGG